MNGSPPLPLSGQLRGLRTAVDAVRLEGLVSRHLAAGRPVRAVRPGYVRFKGEDGALVGWWVSVADAEVLSFVTVRAAAPWRLASEAERLRMRHSVSFAGLEGVAQIDSEELLLLAFPVDRILHDLRALIDVRKVRRILSTIEPPFLATSERVRKSSSRVTLVRYKPERRAVLRWDLVTRREDGLAEGQQTLFFRRHAQDLGPNVAQALEAAREVSVRCPRRFTVVTPSLTIETALEGAPLDFDCGNSHCIESQLASAGRVLARLHGAAPLASLPRLTPRVELDRVYETARNVALLDPTCAQVAERVADRLAENLPPAGRPTLLHGDFHDGQLLFTADEPGLIDFDRAACGPVAYDLASFYAHLELRGLPQSPLFASFLEHHYNAERPLPAPEELKWFKACAVLRLALMAFRLLSHDWPVQMSRLTERAAALAEESA
ncbi:MAG: phosphotransferase [Planctomycetota bacterium]